jgi:hypothetical protein
MAVCPYDVNENADTTTGFYQRRLLFGLPEMSIKKGCELRRTSKNTLYWGKNMIKRYTTGYESLKIGLLPTHQTMFWHTRI